jgi:hypothetical protein
LLSNTHRSTDAIGGGEEKGLSQASPPRIGDWPCACGQRYRVLTEPLTFWAQNSRTGYSPDPSEMCVACGAELEEAFALEAARLVSASLLR